MAELSKGKISGTFTLRMQTKDVILKSSAKPFLVYKVFLKVSIDRNKSCDSLSVLAPICLLLKIHFSQKYF